MKIRTYIIFLIIGLCCVLYTPSLVASTLSDTPMELEMTEVSRNRLSRFNQLQAVDNEAYTSDDQQLTDNYSIRQSFFSRCCSRINGAWQSVKNNRWTIAKGAAIGFGVTVVGSFCTLLFMQGLGASIGGSFADLPECISQLTPTALCQMQYLEPKDDYFTYLRTCYSIWKDAFELIDTKLEPVLVSFKGCGKLLFPSPVREVLAARFPDCSAWGNYTVQFVQESLSRRNGAHRECYYRFISPATDKAWDFTVELAKDIYNGTRAYI